MIPVWDSVFLQATCRQEAGLNSSSDNLLHQLLVGAQLLLLSWECV
jgi:hypothetical protein